MKTLLLFCIAVISIPDLKASVTNNWVLEMDKEGIRVYTLLENNSPYKQIKVTTTINASMEKVLEILKSFEHYKYWMNDITESHLINQSEPGSYYVFTLEDAAWPMQNRYQVSKVNVEQSSVEATVRFRSVPNYIEKRTDAIQIKQHEGYWSLRSRPNRQCSLEYVLIQNPGGHIPPWLANFNAIQNPFNSVANLKKMAEKEEIRP